MKSSRGCITDVTFEEHLHPPSLPSPSSCFSQFALNVSVRNSSSTSSPLKVSPSFPPTLSPIALSTSLAKIYRLVLDEQVAVELRHSLEPYSHPRGYGISNVLMRVSAAAAARARGRRARAEWEGVMAVGCAVCVCVCGEMMCGVARGTSTYEAHHTRRRPAWLAVTPTGSPPRALSRSPCRKKPSWQLDAAASARAYPVEPCVRRALKWRVGGGGSVSVRGGGFFFSMHA